MKVKELLNVLAAADPEAEVKILTIAQWSTYGTKSLTPCEAVTWKKGEVILSEDM